MNINPNIVDFFTLDSIAGRMTDDKMQRLIERVHHDIRKARGILFDHTAGTIVGNKFNWQRFAVMGNVYFVVPSIVGVATTPAAIESEIKRISAPGLVFEARDDSGVIYVTSRPKASHVRSRGMLKAFDLYTEYWMTEYGGVEFPDHLASNHTFYVGEIAFPPGALARQFDAQERTQ